jgi:hypothetical protein
MSVHRQGGHAVSHIAGGSKVFYSLIIVPTALATLSLTLALQAPLRPTGHQIQKAETVWSQLFVAVTDRDLQAVVAFCLIVFLLTLNFILRFPNLGTLIEQYNQF